MRFLLAEERDCLSGVPNRVWATSRGWADPASRVGGIFDVPSPIKRLKVAQNRIA